MPTPTHPRPGLEGRAGRDLVDALDLLRADHVALAGLLQAYALQKDRWRPDKKRLATDAICVALDHHDTLEDEIFYPACERALPDGARLIAAARAEHEIMRVLTAQIGETEPDSASFDPLVGKLAMQLEHHVRAEEGELFPRLRDADVDLHALGAQLARRRAELIATKL